MASEIRRLEEQLVYADPKKPWVKLYFDSVEFPDGTHGRYNRIVEGTGSPGVAVLPISTVGVGLVRQYRYGIEKHVWEIPRGYGDSTNSSREAERELLEETGLQVLELTSLGLVHPNSAVCTTCIELFSAKCDPTPVRATLGGTEQTEFKWFPIAEALTAVDTGFVTDATTLSALLRARLRGLI